MGDVPVTERPPQDPEEFEEWLDRVSGTQSTPIQREYERLLAELMVGGTASINGLDFKLEWS